MEPRVQKTFEESIVSLDSFLDFSEKPNAKIISVNVAGITFPSKFLDPASQRIFSSRRAWFSQLLASADQDKKRFLENLYSFPGSSISERLRAVSEMVFLRRDFENSYDHNAIMVLVKALSFSPSRVFLFRPEDNSVDIGFLPSGISRHIVTEKLEYQVLALKKRGAGINLLVLTWDSEKFHIREEKESSLQLKEFQVSGSLHQVRCSLFVND